MTNLWLNDNNCYTRVDQYHRNIEKATVNFVKCEALGILVNEKYIVTAAHCIECDLSGGMTLGRVIIEEIITSDGKNLKVAAIAIEPVKDIALLGSLDDQIYSEEGENFESFYERTKAVPINLDELELGKRFPIHIYTHKGTWVKGHATHNIDWSATLLIEPDEPIECGTSGGPIINESGELISIVSNINLVDGNQKQEGIAPRPHLALPLWVSRRYLGLNL